MHKFNVTVNECSNIVVGDNANLTIRASNGIPQQRHVPEQATATNATAHAPFQESGDAIDYKAKSGYVLLIHNYSFPKRRDTERQWSAEDVKGLTSLFDDFNFTIKTRNNLEQSEILELLQDASEKDFGKYDCFVCVILSHGSKDGIYGTDDVSINIEAITSYFRRDRCPSLEGKPKIFLIQACRGSQQDSIPIESDSEPIPYASSSLPADADFLICFASAPGHERYRQPELGSWFISAVVKIFKEYAGKEHLMDMMLRVNNHVANFFSNTGLKQIPCQVCMLRRKVFFNPSYNTL
ncbi:Caspase-3 [Stylophora pistillata]|uniref:Caspase-3 n=2 Tax=Stylophora pistillata TaxID=50429 RepID=A0A2B4SJP8_STYPI|nr:Caspase-3 [Stylophora pistillata]